VFTRSPYQEGYDGVQVDVGVELALCAPPASNLALYPRSGSHDLSHERDPEIPASCSLPEEDLSRDSKGKQPRFVSCVSRLVNPFSGVIQSTGCGASHAPSEREDDIPSEDDLCSQNIVFESDGTGSLLISETPKVGDRVDYLCSGFQLLILYLRKCSRPI
jgi:hypothetical protein